MTRSQVRLGLSILGCCVVVGSFIAVADEKKPQGGSDMGGMPPEMMAKMQPGPHHEHLKQFEGTWDCEMKMWMGGPETEPVMSKGTFKRAMILNGRFMEGTFEGTWMGEPFTGRELIGYDNFQGMYFSTWIDNAGTGMWSETGTCDTSGKTFTFAGENFDCMIGSKIKTRSIMTILDADHHKSEMYKTGSDGKEEKMFEMTCTRKK